MAQRRPVHFSGAIYFVSVVSRYEAPIFSEDADRVALNDLVARTTAKCAARVHAFCWLDFRLLMILQVQETALSRIMSRIVAGFARHLNSKVGYKGSLFRHSHRAALLSDAVSLLNAVATVHTSPTSVHPNSDLARYLWSSRRTYQRTEETPWLTTDLVRCHLATIQRVQRMGDGTCEGWEFEWQRTLRRHRRRLPNPLSGPDDEFLAWLQHHSKQRSGTANLDELLRAVAHWLEIEPDAIESVGRGHLPSFARALIVAVATENDIATLSELARHFGRRRSTLHESHEAYRRRVPDLLSISLDQILRGPLMPAEEVLRRLVRPRGKRRTPRSG